MVSICRSVTEPFEFSVDAISHLHLPKAAAWAVDCVHLCHFLGRSLTRLQLRYHHPGMYLAGVLANAKFGDAKFLKVTAQIVLLAQVFLATVEEGGRLVQSCNRLWTALPSPKWISIPYMENRLAHDAWDLQEGHAPSVLFLPWPASIIAAYVIVVVRRIEEVVAHIWKLNLCLFDLYDAVWMDPHSQSTAIDDLFINIHDVANQLTSRERRLSKAVAANSRWIDELLKLVRVDWTADRLVRTLHNFADTAEGAAAVCAAPIQAVVAAASSSCAIAAAITSGTAPKKQTDHEPLHGTKNV